MSHYVVRSHLFVLFVSSWFSSHVNAEERPNFVYIIADDVSPDDIACYGNPTIKTPHIDALSAAGLTFDRAYLTTSSCSPTRCSIITGRYPHNTGAPELHMNLPPGQFMFPQALRAAGYYTVLSGKNHMGPAVEAAFDKVSPSSGPGGEREWVEILRNRPEDKPFFFWFAPRDAHRPWQFTEYDPKYDPANIAVPPYLFDGPETRQDLANYYHEISRIDRFVGVIRNELTKQGIADNTYVIFCADNGRPFPRAKTRLYDSGTKTPFIVACAGRIKPARTQSLISVIDVAPTILELAGVEVDRRVQGVSFASMLADRTATVRDFAFAEHNWHVMQAHERSVRQGNWLYIRNAYPERQNLCVESGPAYPSGKELWEAHDRAELRPEQLDVFLKPRPAEELYEVDQDPYQFHNLATDPARSKTLTKLSRVLDRWIDETGDSVPKRPTPDTQFVSDNRQGMNPDFQRGDMPGADRHAAEVTAPGPIRK